MKLYYHKTSGGAEYLMDNFIEWEHEGKKGKEGTIKGSKYIIRIDGDIEKDAEMSIVDDDNKTLLDEFDEVLEKLWKKSPTTLRINIRAFQHKISEHFNK
jgi:hypothetical protein